MTTEIATQQQETTQARYRALIERTARSTLEGLVGAERLAHAVGRFGLAFRAVASAAPDLYQCTPQSVAQAVGMCALTGLMPGGPYPDVYLLPRKSRIKVDGRWSDGPLQLQWQISWRGAKRLAERSGWTLEAVLVHEGDEWRMERGLHPDVRHVPGDGPQSWDTLRGGYVVAWPPDGSTQRPRFEWLPLAGIEQRRDSSDGYRAWRDGRIKSTPWGEWPLEMARKTVLRYAVSRGIVDLDEVGSAALATDLRSDVIEAEPVTVEVPRLVQAEAPATGMAGLGAALGVDSEQGAAVPPGPTFDADSPGVRRGPGPTPDNTVHPTTGAAGGMSDDEKAIRAERVTEARRLEEALGGEGDAAVKQARDDVWGKWQVSLGRCGVDALDAYVGQLEAACDARDDEHGA